MTATRTIWLGLALVAAAAGLAAETPAPPSPARDYLALRQSLRAVPFTPDIARAARASWRGKSFAMVGCIVGRTNACGASPGKPLTLMLQVPGVVETTLVSSPKDDPLIAVDQVVHLLVQFPEASGPVDNFQLKAIIAEGDLPADQQTYAQALADAESRKTAPAPAGTAADSEKPGDNLNHKPEPPTASPAAQPAAPARPGTEMPKLLATNVPAPNIATWKSWVAGINPRLADGELEVIVRSVLYYSALYGMDHRLAFAVIKCESDFNPRCLSQAGAMGLTQLMPFNLKSLGVSNPWDLEQNVRGGLRYLSRQLHAYAGRSNYEQCALGLASYNAGPNAVKRAGGVPSIPETVRYVRKVTDLFYQLYKSGLP